MSEENPRQAGKADLPAQKRDQEENNKVVGDKVEEAKTKRSQKTPTTAQELLSRRTGLLLRQTVSM